MNSRTIITLVGIVLLGLFARLYQIDNPVADWHSWRQADTAAVTRNFETFGFNPLVPRYDDLSNIQSGMDNPEGYRMVEFPVYQSIVFGISQLFSFAPVSLDMWHRLVSVAFSLCSIVLIYLIGKKYGNDRVGLYSSFFFAVLPFSVYYSRVILPEVLLVTLILATLYFFSRTIVIETQQESITQSFFDRLFIHISFSETNMKPRIDVRFALLFVVAAALSLLLKPMAVFLFLPIPLIWLSLRLFSGKQLIAGFSMAVGILVPFIAWRMWIAHYPEGIPAWDWLFNSDGIRLTGAWFRWLFAERLGKLILGYFGLLLFGIGVLSYTRLNYKPFFTALLGGSLVYLIIFATGNVRHDYYQIMLLPVIVWYLGIGADYIVSHAGEDFKRITSYGVLAITVLFMLMFSWYEVRGYYWINNPAIVEAGMRADVILPPQARVIAPYGGDTAFLYQTRRQGWPIGFEIDDKIQKGATYYVSVMPDDPEVLELKERFTVIEETERYIIIQLS